MPKTKKERLQKRVYKRYQDLVEYEKEKQLQYACERYKNLPEHEKQKLVNYRKKYYKMWKNRNALQSKTFSKDVRLINSVSSRKKSLKPFE